MIKDLGPVSAYAYAVEKGYTGTEEEFALEQAGFAQNAQNVAEDRRASEVATNKTAEDARKTAQDAKSAQDAKTGASTALKGAEDARDVASQKAKEAGTSATNAQTAQGKAEQAQTGAESARDTATQKATEAGTNAKNAQDSATKAKTEADAIKTDREQIQRNKGNFLAEQNRVNNVFASAFAETVSGSVIAVDDVSPIPHDVAIKVESENLLSRTALMFRHKEIGGLVLDVLDDNETIKIHGKNTSGKFVDFSPYNLVLSQYDDLTLSFEGGDEKLGFVFGGGGYDVKRGTTLESKTVKLQNNAPMQYIYLRIEADIELNVSCKIKLQSGTVATPYTPFVDVSKTKLIVNGSNFPEETMPVDLKGSLIANSRYPNMKLKSDTEGVQITATYNQDAKKWVMSQISELMFGGGYNRELIQKNADNIAKALIKNRISGNPITIADSAEFPLQELEIVGSTVQDGEPSPTNPVEIVNGVMDRVSDTGKNLFNIDNITKSNNKYNRYEFHLKPLTKYVLSTNAPKFKTTTSICVNGGSSDKDGACIDKPIVTTTDSDGFMYVSIRNAPLPAEEETYDMYGLVKSGKCWIQLEEGVIPTLYEPYKGFSETLANLELSKWDRVIKKDGLWYKENNTKRTRITETLYDYKILNVYEGFTRLRLNVMDKAASEFIYCEKFKTEKRFSSNAKPWQIFQDSNPKSFPYVILFTFPSDINTADLAIQWFRDNPTEILYKLKEPTLEPLPPETQAVLNRLQTFYPNTVISTNNGISLNLKYVADTKTYIDNGLLNIQQALLEGK